VRAGKCTADLLWFTGHTNTDSICALLYTSFNNNGFHQYNNTHDFGRFSAPSIRINNQTETPSQSSNTMGFKTTGQ